MRSTARTLVRGLVRGALAAPELSMPLVGAPPVSDRGVVLDAQAHVLLRALDRSRQPSAEVVGPERARLDARARAWIVAPPAADVARIDDRSIERADRTALPLRIYVPHGSRARRAATLYFHGGGFVIGDLETHDAVCRGLAERSGTVVIAVDYRLAPEHPFPAGVEDALTAFRWVRDHAAELAIDRTRIAVAGDSAGGNFAAVVCQQTRDELGPAFQLLIYPACDLTCSADSHALFAEGFFLTRSMMDWFIANYVTDAAHKRDPRASPLATRDLTGLPPAHVVTAGFDPLRDEGEAYAHALIEAGVPTTLRCYESLIHGFVNMGGLIDAARVALDDLGDVLRRRLAR